jgi:hypothetical protein
MRRRLVFIPIAPDEMGALAGRSELVDRTAYSVTPELLEELGYGAEETEDAEYAALILASVAGLAAHGTRLIVVAEVDPASVEPGDDPTNGQVRLRSCPASAITAWFADEPGVDVADAAAISKGMTIDQAWDQPAVQDLLHNHDLLWNDVVEYRREG